MPSVELIARTINGPNESTHIGITKLREVQDISWGRLKAQEQAALLRSARFIQQLFEEQPDGWVITSIDDRYVRFWDTTGEYVGTEQPNWCKDLGMGLWFARRIDAERFCEGDEEAGHIRRASDVRAMWGARAPSEGVPAPSTGAPYALGAPERVDAPQGTSLRYVPPTLPVDTNSLNDLLRLFRQFVLANATQWKAGSNHHHPIWQDIAVAIDKEEATFGPDWAFIQPENRKPHALLLEEYVDHTNEFEATQRGG